MIETYGVKQSTTIGIILTSIGMWFNYAGLSTIGSVFVSIGMPFVANVATKVSALWFGPKGRNITTTILLLGFFIPQAIDEFLE